MLFFSNLILSYNYLFQHPGNIIPVGYCLFVGDESNYTEFLPEWLRVLIACACWLPSAIPLQFVAISTLLDLIELCRTAQSLVQTSSEDVLTPVLILPLLSPPHLRFIEKHTYIFQVSFFILFL